jgi:hypothetical protein
MIEGEQSESRGWRCRHLSPVLVVAGPEGERRVRCLRCGAQGPSRSGLAQAIRALRESFSGLERLE